MSGRGKDGKDINDVTVRPGPGPASTPAKRDFLTSWRRPIQAAPSWRPACASQRWRCEVSGRTEEETRDDLMIMTITKLPPQSKNARALQPNASLCHALSAMIVHEQRA
jgi:hypothetical protein